MGELKKFRGKTEEKRPLESTCGVKDARGGILRGKGVFREVLEDTETLR